MRILHIIDKLNVGGAENVAVSLVNIFSEKGEDVAILSLLDEGELCESLNNDVKQLFLYRRNKLSISTYIKFYNIIKDYDILHVHMRHNLKYVVLCKVFCNNKFPRIVFHDHTGGLSNNFLLKTVFSYVDIYIGVSKKNIDWALNKMKISEVYILPNIIRKENILPVKKDKDFVMIGNIRPEKNYEFIFKLSNRINKGIDIYGNFVNEDYKSYIQKLKPENVNIYTGESKMQKIIKSYKMALHCAPLETGPLVLIEYLAQGIPFVSYNTGEVIDQIREYLPEFIVYSFDESEWINTIRGVEQMINDDMTGLQQKIKRVYEYLFSENKYYESCMKIYKSI